MIAVYGNCARLPLDSHELADRLERMLRRLGVTADVELECVRDGEIMRLNREHMACPGPTNILSFPAGEADFLGSLALSADCLDREARLYAQPADAYCLKLLAHGLAHLLGHDHGPAMDAVCAAMLGSEPPDA